MSKTLLVKAADVGKSPLTKLLCDMLTTYTSYLMDDVPYPAIMDRIHSLDTTALPFDVDCVFEYMFRLKEDMIDDRNK